MSRSLPAEFSPTGDILHATLEATALAGLLPRFNAGSPLIWRRFAARRRVPIALLFYHRVADDLAHGLDDIESAVRRANRVAQAEI